MSPKISVIIPVYNGEKYLKETLDSIVQQTFRDFELLLIDDASSDGSLQILHEYAKVDDRIRVFGNKQNMGIAETTNFGIAQAAGEFIALSDQDDVSAPERFDQQIIYLGQHPEISVLGTQTISFSPDCEVEERKSAFPLTPGAIRWGLIFGCMLANPTVIFRREIFVEHGFRFSKYRVAQDFDLFTRISPLFKFANLPQALVFHRIHDKNASKTSSLLQQNEHYEITKNHVFDLIGEELSDDIISGILFAKHQKKIREIENINIAYNVSKVLVKLRNQASSWDVSKQDLVFINQNTASRLRHIWKNQRYHPFLLPYVLFSVYLDPDIGRRMINRYSLIRS